MLHRLIAVALVTVASTMGGTTWKPIAAKDSVVTEIKAAAGEFFTVCVDQRDLDLRLTLTSSSDVHSVDANVYGRECVHAIAAETSGWTLIIEAANKRYGRGSYRIRSIARRQAVASDEFRLAAQQRLHEARIEEDKPDRTSRDLALERLLSAADLAKRGGDLRREAECRSRAANLLHVLGRYELASGEFRQAINLWERLSEPLSLFVARVDYERLYAEMGRRGPILAGAGMVEGWRRFADRRGLGMALRHAGRLAADRYRFIEARSHLGEAQRACEAIDDIICQAKIVENLRDISNKLSDRRAALTYATRRLQIADELKDARGRAAALAGVGQQHFDLGEFELAIVNLQEAIKLRIEQGDESAATQAEALMGRAYRRIGRIDEALSLATQAMSRSDRLHAPVRDSLWRTELRNERVAHFYMETIAEHAFGEGSRDAAETAFGSIDHLRGRFLLERYARPLVLPEIAKLPGPEDTVISFIPSDDGVLAWVLSIDHCQIIRIGFQSAIWKSLERLRLGLARGREVHSTIATVSRHLLGPLASSVWRKRTILSAGEPFQSIPFGVLLDPTTNYRKHLAETREIVYVPSLEFLANSRAEWEGRTHSRRRLVALGDAVYRRNDSRLPPSESAPAAGVEPELIRATRAVLSSGTLPRLPFTRREVQDVMREAGPDGKAFLGWAASKDLFVGDALRDFDLLHIASHGLLNQHSPDLSGIVLSLFDSRGRAVPAFLRLPDIMDSDRLYRLVVLSACQTGLGKPITGEASLGLTTAFLRAGAKTVVSSLWKVDDEVTAVTMRYFYRAYLGQGMGPAAALAYAQEKIRSVRQWKHPYYWAGFIVTGDWLP